MINPGNLILTTRGDREIVMTREFNAPRRLVFDAFTKPELVKQWLLGPDYPVVASPGDPTVPIQPGQDIHQSLHSMACTTILVFRPSNEEVS